MPITKGFSDLPIQSEKDDLFGLQNYYRCLANFIDHCETPFTIALQGDWGTGKTSMMNNIALRLKKYTIIKFNTWQYAQFSGESSLSIALLNEITKAVENELGAGEKAVKALKDKLLKITKGLNFTLELPKIGLLCLNGEKESPVGDEYYESIKTFHHAFETAVKALIAKNKKKNNREESKVVFFIDDLDRLNPARAVELLEIIKIFLDVEGCVFVLSIDYDVVDLGIKNKYGDQMSYEKGKSFFDKMIQLPFKIPVHLYKMDQLINQTFQRLEILNIENLTEDSKYYKLMLQCIGSNPRMVKRLLNSFELLVDILNIDNEKSDQQQKKYFFLLFILKLQLYDEHLYRYLLNNSVDWKLPPSHQKSIFNSANHNSVFIRGIILDEHENKDAFSVKNTILSIHMMDAFLEEDEIVREENIDLFQIFLQHSQMTSSGTAKSLPTKIIELGPESDSELANSIIQALIIENKEIPFSTFRDVFIFILESTVTAAKFKKFAADRHKTQLALLPDRIFNEIDNKLTGTDIKYPASSIKTVHGVPLVFHYGRKDLNRYLFRFLDAFDVKSKFYLKVVEMNAYIEEKQDSPNA